MSFLSFIFSDLAFLSPSLSTYLEISSKPTSLDINEEVIVVHIKDIITEEILLWGKNVL